MAHSSDTANPQNMINALLAEDGERRACEVVELLAKEENFADLLTLARALEARVDRSDKAKLAAFELLADHVEDQVALSGSDSAVDALFTLTLEARERSVAVPRSHAVRLRAFASRLGYGHTPRGFLAALERHSENAAHQELLACWMHEVILRGNTLANEAQAKKLREKLVNAGHPLGALPLALLETEREVPSYMPLYGEKGLGRAIDALTSGVMSIRSIPPPAEVGPVVATLLEDEAVQARLVTAVRPWAEGKNGKTEAKVFTLSRKVDPSSVGRSLLGSLALDSTAGGARLDVSRPGPEGVYGPLFSAASNGGAYSSGLGGAYGRRAAWTSFGALVGAADGADVTTIDRLAFQSSFLAFRAEGPWFHDIAWDLGVLALRPNGLSVAAIAATDTE